jgi:predicted nucleic acid-binding protein
VTLLEVLVRPLRYGEAKLAQRYREFLLESNNITTVSLDQEIAEEASRLRALYSSIRTPDAIQMATAIRANASFFLTNDTRFPSIPNLKTLIVDDLKKETDSEQQSQEP